LCNFCKSTIIEFTHPSKSCTLSALLLFSGFLLSLTPHQKGISIAITAFKSLKNPKILKTKQTLQPVSTAMDFSSYDYHKYQQQPQSQQQQQQQQQEEAYDSSQNQPTYDYSSYYSYAHQYDQSYPYYPSSHQYTNTNSYTQQSQSQSQYQPAEEPTSSIHPPGVPVPSQQQTHLQSQQNTYYPQQGAVENQQQVNPATARAAVARLSQLTQFAGNVQPTVMGFPY
jgi:hypothetical protein